MKINLKYNATKVDEIEQVNKTSIENCISDTSISNLALFVQKGYVNENGAHGVSSRSLAIKLIDEYLVENEKNDLVMDIMEALIEGGFLSRELDINKVRELTAKQQALVKEELDKNI